jgi:AcrR family transcriptional regulator
MARRSAEQTKREIKSQLIKVTAKRGIEGASTKEVAAKIGISEPAIYVHFHTKANLFNQTFIFCCHEFAESPVVPLNYGKEARKESFEDYQRKITKAIAKPAYIKYIYEYLQSDHFDPKTAGECEDLFLKSTKDFLRAHNSNLSDAEIRYLAYQCVNADLRYAINLVRGQVVRNDRTDYLAFCIGSYGVVSFLEDPSIHPGLEADDYSGVEYTGE